MHSSSRRIALTLLVLLACLPASPESAPDLRLTPHDPLLPTVAGHLFLGLTIAGCLRGAFLILGAGLGLVLALLLLVGWLASTLPSKRRNDEPSHRPSGSASEPQWTLLIDKQHLNIPPVHPPTIPGRSRLRTTSREPGWQGYRSPFNTRTRHDTSNPNLLG